MDANGGPVRGAIPLPLPAVHGGAQPMPCPRCRLLLSACRDVPCRARSDAHGQRGVPRDAGREDSHRGAPRCKPGGGAQSRAERKQARSARRGLALASVLSLSGGCVWLPANCPGGARNQAEGATGAPHTDFALARARRGCGEHVQHRADAARAAGKHPAVPASVSVAWHVANVHAPRASRHATTLCARRRPVPCRECDPRTRSSQSDSRHARPPAPVGFRRQAEHKAVAPGLRSVSRGSARQIMEIGGESLLVVQFSLFMPCAAALWNQEQPCSWTGLLRGAPAVLVQEATMMLEKTVEHHKAKQRNPSTRAPCLLSPRTSQRAPLRDALATLFACRDRRVISRDRARALPR